MKKLIAILLATMLIFTCAVTAFAAGQDDGSLIVATKDGKRFFGVALAENFDKYVAADGSDTVFYDMNGDRTMNVCDLVALTNNKTDFDQNGSFGAEDSAAMRTAVLNDF